MEVLDALDAIIGAAKSLTNPAMWGIATDPNPTTGLKLGPEEWNWLYVMNNNKTQHQSSN